MSPWAGLYDDLYLHPFPPSFGPRPWLETIRPIRPMGIDGVVANAFSDLDVDAMLTVGRSLEPDSIKPCPPNVRVEQYLPQRLVLARSSLLVSHAGSGAVLGAASRGIPQLCLPFAADQFENVDVVVASGRGLSLEPREVNGDSVRDSILRLLGDESFRAGAQSVADEIAAMPEPSENVATIEMLSERTQSA